MKGILKTYFQPSFLITILVLFIFAGGISYYKSVHGVTLIKKALPLKQPFDKLDESALEPYKVIHKSNITNKDILESLGTEEYLQWTFEDTTVGQFSPVRHVSVFLTYYTGNPDQVPHVPEACYTGGGNAVEEKFSIKFDVSDSNCVELQKAGKIPATGLMFSKKSAEIWKATAKFPVIYFFKVNGKYKGGRGGTRVALGDLANEYSYFSKVEVSFSNLRGVYPDKQQAADATEKLLKVLLPVIEKNHWPDWGKTKED